MFRDTPVCHVCRVRRGRLLSHHVRITTAHNTTAAPPISHSCRSLIKSKSLNLFTSNLFPKNRNRRGLSFGLPVGLYRLRGGHVVWRAHDIALNAPRYAGGYPVSVHAVTPASSSRRANSAHSSERVGNWCRGYASRRRDTIVSVM